MGVDDLQPKSKEVVKQINTTGTNTIETVLQQKLQDPVKESFFLNILNNPTIASVYSKNSLSFFIQ